MVHVADMSLPVQANRAVLVRWKSLRFNLNKYLLTWSDVFSIKKNSQTIKIHTFAYFQHGLCSMHIDEGEWACCVFCWCIFQYDRATFEREDGWRPRLPVETWIACVEYIQRLQVAQTWYAGVVLNLAEPKLYPPFAGE